MSEIIKTQLDSVFDPQSIAFIGASNDLSKWGGFTLYQTLLAGYRGRAYPISRMQNTVQGLPAYRSVLDVPDKVDMAVFTIPAALCPKAMEECVQKGVKAAIVISGGFAEIGEEGKTLQKELIRIAKTGGIRVVGPNGMGVWSATSRLCLPVGFNPAPKSGPIAFFSQSGTFGVYLVSHASAKGYGLGRFVSAGNQADLGPADYLEYADQDPETKVIVFYMEGITEGHRFVEVAREVIKRKPIIIHKAGRSQATAKVMMSHTGSLSGSDEVFDAMCHQIGIIRTSEAVQAFDFAQALATRPLPRGKRVGIVTPGGGFCVTLTDKVGQYDLDIPTLDDAAQAKIKPLMLPHAPAPANPIDTGGDTNLRTIPMIARQLADLDYIDGVITSVPGFAAMALTSEMVEHVAHATRTLVSIPKEKKKPLILVGFPGRETLANGVLRTANIPIYDNPEDAARAMAALMYYGHVQRVLIAESAKLKARTKPTAESRSAAMAIINKVIAEGRFSLSEHEGKGVLSAYGIPVTREKMVQSSGELAKVLKDFSLPVAMKVDSPDILHKTEAGIIRLNVSSAAEATAVYEELMEKAHRYNPQARINGVLVQEMVTDSVECLIGVSHDPQFGPTVTFGLGGIFVEVMKDVSLRVAPLTERDATRMIRHIKGYKILEGVRGQTPRDITAIRDAILKVSQMAMDLSDVIAEVDINPLMVGAEGKGVKAVDALIVLRQPGNEKMP